MPSPITSSRTVSPDKLRRLTHCALAALVIGAGAGALTAVPLGNPAFAKNSGDHGGGNGNGHDGGKGGGHGNSHGGGNGNGNGHSKGGSGDDAGASDGDTSGPGGETGDGDDHGQDESLSPHGLGKLNGFFHASPRALAHASPNSAIGRLSQTFRDALSDYAAHANDPDGTPDDGSSTGPTTNDLGAILAGATNKPVTPTQVEAIVERLAEVNPDDAALGDLAHSLDDDTAQDIADAANAAHSGEDGPDSM